MLPDEKCGQCRFYNEKMEKQGECRRYAPRPNVLKINWSKVSIDHWCGEFERKKPALSEVEGAAKGLPIDQEHTD